MKEKLNRRDFIKMGAGIGAILATSGFLYQERRPKPHIDPILGIHIDENEKKLSTDELKAFATRMQNAINEIPPRHYNLDNNTLETFAVEAAPFFESEGLTISPVPPKIFFVPYYEGGQHEYQLGGTFCSDRHSEINFRFANPFAEDFSQRADWETSVLHEMYHAMVGCHGVREEEELAAQLGMVIIGSAMVNSGDEEVLPALLWELRDMALGTLLFNSYQNHTIPDYDAFISDLFENPIKDAERARSERFWTNNGFNLLWMLNTYDVVPFKKIIEGLQKGKMDVYVPDTYGNFNENANGKTVTFRFDDLRYILEHLDELTTGLKDR